MITKKCTGCKKDLPATAEYFAGRTDKKKPTLQSRCRKCHKEYRREHYLQNKEKYIRKANKYNTSIFEWYSEIKSNLKCSNCPEDRPWVLDFHHTDPSTKDNNLAFLARRGSKPRILKEIAKCIVLCANCHRDLHYQQNRC